MPRVIAPKLVWIGLLTGLMAGLAGCGGGGDRVRAVGTVVYADGAPLPGGLVTFRSKSAPTPILARGVIAADGRFELSVDQAEAGLPTGEYEVAVAPAIPDDRGTMTAAEFDRARRPIDAKFRNYETSGLRVTVTNDEAQNDFRIEVERPRR